MSSDGSEDYGDQYELATFFRRVLSVTDAPLRRRQVERHFTTVDAPTVAAHLQELLAMAVGGDPDANEMLFPIGAFIHTAQAPEALALEAIDLAARQAELHGVAWLLLDPPPSRVIEPRALARMNTQSESLGHRKAAAATRSDPATLERLSHDNHAMVIDKLCQNPRVMEAHIMTVVTRRPTVPELLATVAAHPRWYQRASVREALVYNPYGPTGLALRTLPTLNARIWEAIRFAGQVHPAVQAFAGYLLDLRSGDATGPGPDSLHETKH